MTWLADGRSLRRPVKHSEPKIPTRRRVPEGSRDAARQMTSEKTTVVDHSLAERRRYKREKVDLAGRQFEPAENREAQCKIVDLSPGGARVLSEVVPPPGALVVIYIDGFGRIEGSIARTAQNGFGIQFNCSAQKRERFAELLKLYMSGSPLDETTLRRHDRRSAKGSVSFTRADGNVVN